VQISEVNICQLYRNLTFCVLRCRHCRERPSRVMSQCAANDAGRQQIGCLPAPDVSSSRVTTVRA